jgi:hypothetical protein
VLYLDIYFKNGDVDAYLQYETLINATKQRIDGWKDRDLSLHNRALCFNVVMFSRL